jgi:hypothetical protein
MEEKTIVIPWENSACSFHNRHEKSGNRWAVMFFAVVVFFVVMQAHFFPAVLVCQHQLLYCGVLCFFLETLISFQPDLGPRVTKSSKDILLFLQRATISSF